MGINWTTSALPFASVYLTYFKFYKSVLKPLKQEEPQKIPYPRSVAFIVANEFCERFAYYGIRTVLSLYMRNKLHYSDNGATIIYHTFSMLAYFFPIPGAIIADGWLGRFKTIVYISLIYTCGAILMSLSAIPPLHLPTRTFSLLALLLIAIGSGGVKPCIAAFGGDQFKLPEQEKHLSSFFSIFYFAVNAGSLVATFLTPILRKDIHCFSQLDCYPLSFGIPSILMVVAIVCFLAGKRFYVRKAPAGNIIGKVSCCIAHALVMKNKSKEKRQHWLDHASDKYDTDLIEDVKKVMRVLVLYIPLPIFWALFDQQGSRWTLQADRMRHEIGPYTLKADQMQLLNPLLCLILLPLFEVAIYPFLIWAKLIRKTLHRMIWGGTLAAVAFIFSGIVELSLLSSYGTPLEAGFAQLRVYNGFDCGFTIQLNNGLEKGIIPPLSFYESLHFKANGAILVPYSIVGKEGTECASKSHDGTFTLIEKTANSFFIGNTGITDFIDNNGKAIDGANIRFLCNIDNVVGITLKNGKTDDVHMQSDDTTQIRILNGNTDLIVDGKAVFNNFDFKTGGVYTINIAKKGGDYVARAVVITPPNTLHILWQIPQYLIMTMGEVMFSVTGLEFSFTQAPASMKCILQSIWLITVAGGNLIVVLIVHGNFLDAQWKEFFLFAGLMLIDMLIFTVMAFRYKYVVHKASTADLNADNSKAT